jgi:hypothetical protein
MREQNVGHLWIDIASLLYSSLLKGVEAIKQSTLADNYSPVVN